jgi:uncharacterized protein (DUF433 family)
MSTPTIIGRGVYSLREAAKLTHLQTAKVRAWFLGRGGDTPVLESDYAPIGGDHAISFLDLVELFIIGKLRNLGVSLQYLRKIYNRLEIDYGKHPFCTREISLSDTNKKKKIFTSGLNDSERNQLIEVMTRQRYFETIIGPFLKKIDYDEATHLARRWHIANMVVIDPTIQFGKPIVEEVGISTSILRNAYYANGENAEFVAHWFGIHARHVRASVDFENNLAA